MGSDFAHRYAEGHPGERYYQGTEIIDEIESLLKQHMKSLFHCRHADVRPISGTIANDAVFSRYISPGDVVMVNSTPAGGHISHHRAGSVGKYTQNIVNFPLTADGYHIDVDRTARPDQGPGPQGPDPGQEPVPVPRAGEGALRAGPQAGRGSR